MNRGLQRLLGRYVVVDHETARRRLITWANRRHCLLCEREFVSRQLAELEQQRVELPDGVGRYSVDELLNAFDALSQAIRVAERAIGHCDTRITELDATVLNEPPPVAPLD